MFDIPVSKMNDKQLRDAVQLLSDELAVFMRKYEDTIHNLDGDNLGKSFTIEQKNMKNQIKITADAIKTMVSDTDLQSALANYTSITQTANAIRTVASKGANLDEAEEIYSLSQATDRDAIYVIRDRDVYGNVTGEEYYYYNELSKDWEILSGDSIYTVFNQTAHGFELRGNVAISGDLITEGTISAARIDTEDLSCTKLYSKDFAGTFYAKIASGMGDFGVYGSAAEASDDPRDNSCVWGFYNIDPIAQAVCFYMYGNNYMRYNGSQGKLYPVGFWDFSACDHVEFGKNAPVAIFG